MIGTQPVGTLSGVVISAVSHEGISVTVDGKAARLAILTDDGRVIAAGKQVAKEVEAVALNSYRNFLKADCRWPVSQLTFDTMFQGSKAS